MEKIYQFIANKLMPRKLLYWASIRAWAIATTGKWGSTVATDIKMDTVVKRLESPSS